jgi:hypothetical protein
MMLVFGVQHDPLSYTHQQEQWQPFIQTVLPACSLQSAVCSLDLYCSEASIREHKAI